MAAPVVGLAAGAAAMLQMLLPPVMYVVDQSSSVRQKPEERAKLTGDYTVTITYGDVASAERAGEHLRRLHATRTAVDPNTGASYRADDPDSLAWVHQALTWMILRAVREYGPNLTPAEEDQFVKEQRAVAARLVGCDLEKVSEKVADLDTYMDAMIPRLAKTTPVIWFKEMMVPTDFPKGPGDLVKRLFTHAYAMLMSEEQQELYGFRFNFFQRVSTVNGTKALLKAASSNGKLDSAIPAIRDYVDAHAFGAKRARIVDPT
ncbi:MAG: oxygenase MpaB family protein [Actinomycetota bacterium]|nr:oxygenase MpaB family protein [Actinomycetota bacterium]